MGDGCGCARWVRVRVSDDDDDDMCAVCVCVGDDLVRVRCGLMGDGAMRYAMGVSNVPVR